TLDHERSRSSASLPCRSGRLRSRTTRSGELNVAILSPSAAFSASTTEKPWISYPARRKRLIFGSSSIRRTRLLGLLIVADRQFSGRGLIGGHQDRRRGSETLATTRDLNRPAMCPDKGGRDPEAEAGSRDAGVMALAAKRFAPDMALLVRRDADT